MLLGCLTILIALNGKGMTTADDNGTQTPEVPPEVYHWSLGDKGTVEISNKESCSGATFQGGGVIPYDIRDAVRLIPAPDVVEDACAVWLDYDRVDFDIYEDYDTPIDLGPVDGTCVSDPGRCTSDGFTWSVWLKLLHRSHDYTSASSLIRSGYGVLGSRFNLWYTQDGHILCSARNDTARLSVRVTVTAFIPLSASTPEESQWFHVACVFKFSGHGDVAKAYINGVKEQPLQNVQDSFDYEAFEEGEHLSNGLFLGYYSPTSLGYSHSCGYSNLVVTDGILEDDDIQRLYSCGSTDQDAKLRSLVWFPASNDTASQLLCTASATGGPSVDWQICVKDECGEFIDQRYFGLFNGGVRIENHNISSCVLTSSLTIESIYEQQYEGHIIVCSVSTSGSSTKESANFTVPVTETLSEVTTPRSQKSSTRSNPLPDSEGTTAPASMINTASSPTNSLPSSPVASTPPSPPLLSTPSGENSVKSTSIPHSPAENNTPHLPSSRKNHANSSDDPEPETAEADIIGQFFESFHGADCAEETCYETRIYEKEDKVITASVLSAAEGDYDQVTAGFDGLVYKANIPGIKLTTNETIVVLVTIYKSHGNSSRDINVSGEMNNSARFGSQVISLDVVTEDGKSFTDFHEAPIKLIFPVSEILKDESPICSFRSSDKAKWYTYGCRVTNVSGGDVTCSCDHLTHFAILLQLQEVEIRERDSSVLKLLTRIGLGLSIACLVITLLVYAFCRLTSVRIVTHANLAFSLMASHITFLFIDIQNPAACTAVAVLLHFFLLGAFTWMALEGVFLYIQSTPTSRWKIRLPVWLLIGWGCPTIVVAVSVAVRLDAYTRSGSCWLSFDDGLVWAFLAPAICIIIGNTVILIRLLRVFSSLKSNKDKSEAAKMRARLRLMLILEPLLGMPWILGFFYINDTTVVFAYLFVILNSLQGVFVFTCQCFFDHEVRQKFRAKMAKIRATSVIPDTSGVSTTSKSIMINTAPGEHTSKRFGMPARADKPVTINDVGDREIFG